MKLLLENGADPNISFPDGKWSPIFEAVENNSAEIVELLISAGANVNATDYSGKTPLDIAKEKG